MDWFEFIILVLFIAAAFFLIYYYFRGAKGDIALTRPVESRVDEYLDRRFESLVDEWELVNQPKLQKFKEQKSKEIEQDEIRLADLKKFELDLENSLTKLEGRLDGIEKGLAQKGSTEE
jgi:archaellum component FlaC